jgi:hypothetical protein
VPEVAARPGQVRTRKAAAATESTGHVAATESTAHMAAAEPAAHMTATEPAAHMAATAEAATVSTPATATATRKRVSGQSPGKSSSHSQNDHGLA